MRLSEFTHNDVPKYFCSTGVQGWIRLVRVKDKQNVHSSRKTGYCFYELNFLPIKMGLYNELIKPCEVEVEVRKIKHVQKHI